MFVTDTRSHRNTTAKEMLGKKQTEALFDWTRKASAEYVAARQRDHPVDHLAVIASPSVAMARLYHPAREGWWESPGQLQKLLDLWRSG